MTSKINTVSSLLRKSILLSIAAIFVYNTEGILAQEQEHETESTHHVGPTHDDHDEGNEEPFNTGEFIQHHVQDAHEMTWAGYHIPLPVLLWAEDGFKIFSSSQFYKHGKDEHHLDMDGHAHISADEEFILVNEVIYYFKDNGGLEGIKEKLIKQEKAKELGAELTTLNAELKNAVDNENEGLKATIKGLEEEKLSLDQEGKLLAPFDISITKNVAGFLLVCLLIVIIFGRVAKRMKSREGKAPKGIQNVFEPLILFVRDDIAVPAIGAAKADRFTPFLLSVFFFIWISNMLGLIPFLVGFNITGTLSITLVMAVVVFIITTVKGNKGYWQHIFIPPGVPKAVLLILSPIEFAGIFIKPAVLMIRLTANITAGHIIILAFVSLIFIFGASGEAGYWGVGIGSTLFMIFMYLIEFLVAFLQAYVFTLLAAIYFGSAVEEAHH